ncbi:hypothetical protein ABH924_004438 [Arthrobacter sp. GAS37]
MIALLQRLAKDETIPNDTLGILFTIAGEQLGVRFLQDVESG